jgi:hypothetical protein
MTVTLSTDELCPLCNLPPDECECFDTLNGDTSQPIPPGSLTEYEEHRE